MQRGWYFLNVVLIFTSTKCLALIWKDNIAICEIFKLSVEVCLFGCLLVCVLVFCAFWTTLSFYSTPYRGRVYKWKFCPFICLSVCLSSLLILCIIQTLSSRNLPQPTLVTQPLPWYPMSPIHVSHAR